MLRLAVSTIAFLGLMIFTAGATAAPPVVDQYTEQIPTAGGDEPSSEIKTRDASDDPTSHLSVAGTGSGGSGNPTSSGSSASVSESGNGNASDPSPDGAATNDSTASLEADGPADAIDTNGMGVVFPAILAIVFLLTVLTLVLRKHGAFTSRAT